MRIGVTGGIGSGKSTVCRLFAVLGIPVYDSDACAKRLMNDDPALVQGIKRLLGEESYRDGALNRAYVGSRVFADAALLVKLNGLVHPAVGADFLKWCDDQTDARYVILESAILFESGFNRYVNRVVTVSAPEQERIDRTCKRDGAMLESIRARMANQMSDVEREQRADYVICNEERRMITDQVLALDKIFNDNDR